MRDRYLESEYNDQVFIETDLETLTRGPSRPIVLDLGNDPKQSGSIYTPDSDGMHSSSITRRSDDGIKNEPPPLGESKDTPNEKSGPVENTLMNMISRSIQISRSMPAQEKTLSTTFVETRSREIEKNDDWADKKGESKTTADTKIYGKEPETPPPKKVIDDKSEKDSNEPESPKKVPNNPPETPTPTPPQQEPPKPKIEPPKLDIPKPKPEPPELKPPTPTPDSPAQNRTPPSPGSPEPKNENKNEDDKPPAPTIKDDANRMELSPTDENNHHSDVTDNPEKLSDNQNPSPNTLTKAKNDSKSLPGDAKKDGEQPKVPTINVENGMPPVLPKDGPAPVVSDGLDSGTGSNTQNYLYAAGGLGVVLFIVGSVFLKRKSYALASLKYSLVSMTMKAKRNVKSLFGKDDLNQGKHEVKLAYYDDYKTYNKNYYTTSFAKNGNGEEIDICQNSLIFPEDETYNFGKSNNRLCTATDSLQTIHKYPRTEDRANMLASNDLKSKVFRPVIDKPDNIYSIGQDLAPMKHKNYRFDEYRLADAESFGRAQDDLISLGTYSTRVPQQSLSRVQPLNSDSKPKKKESKKQSVKNHKSRAESGTTSNENDRDSSSIYSKLSDR